MERSKVEGECCERCGSKGFTWDRFSVDGRPVFYCSTCGDIWSYGKDGGPYMKYAKTAKIHRGQQQFLAEGRRPNERDDEIIRNCYSNKKWKKRDKRPHMYYGYDLFYKPSPNEDTWS
jgi:hypothetical protein